MSIVLISILSLVISWFEFSEAFAVYKAVNHENTTRHDVGIVAGFTLINLCVFLFSLLILVIASYKLRATYRSF